MAQQRKGYRTPRYGVFLLSGAFLGALVALSLATFAPGPDATGGSGTFAYLTLVGALVGALLGGTVAVVAEKAVNRGTRDPLRDPDRVSGPRGPARRPRRGTPPS